MLTHGILEVLEWTLSHRNWMVLCLGRMDFDTAHVGRVPLLRYAGVGQVVTGPGPQGLTAM